MTSTSANLEVLSADKTLLNIVTLLKHSLQPDKIYLFGSKARGDYSDDSDYDILIVAPDNAPEHCKKSGTAYQALRGTRVATDVIVVTQSWFERRLNVVSSLPATIAREGILLYEK